MAEAAAPTTEFQRALHPGFAPPSGPRIELVQYSKDVTWQALPPRPAAGALFTIS